MMKMELNRAMARLRHLNEEMFVVVNDLWRTIGRDNIFTFKFTLTYVLSYLEEYLELSEKRYMMLERNDFKLGESDNVKVNMFEAALEGFIKMEDDPKLPKVNKMPKKKKATTQKDDGGGGGGGETPGEIDLFEPNAN